MKRRRRGRRRLGRRILLAGLLLLGYIITGALLPFAFPKGVEGVPQMNLSYEDFFAEAVGVDRAALAESNTDALEFRLNLFEQAKENIIISTFDIREGNSTTDLFASLLAAADRGVKVQIIVDGLYGFMHMEGKPIFYAAGSHPNVEIRFYNPPSLIRPWSINGRLHDKYVIIDDKYLLMGGRNMFDYFIGVHSGKTVGYDREVLVYNTAAGSEASNESVISQAQAYFDGIWELKSNKTVFEKDRSSNQAEMEALAAHYRDELDIDDYAEHGEALLAELTVPIHKATFLYNPTHTGVKEPYVWYWLKVLMENAEERVLIQSPYAVLSKEMYRGLTEISEKVGDVTLMINSIAIGDNFVASSDYTQNKDKVAGTGVQLLEYFGDHSSHGKSLLIDNDISVVGSYNLDMRSTYVDTETMLVIHGEEFYELLDAEITELEASALEVTTDGYLPKEGIEVKEIPSGKKFLFAITSKLVQLVRYLV